MDDHLRAIFRLTQATPTMDNKVLLHEHYRRAGLLICNCENGYCQSCNQHGGFGCIYPGDPKIWIQMIGPTCGACAMDLSIEYHGDVDTAYDPSRWKGCECYWCSRLDAWSRKWLKIEGRRPLPKTQWKFGPFVDKQRSGFARVEFRHRKDFRVVKEDDEGRARIYGQSWVEVPLTEWPLYEEYMRRQEETRA